MTSFEKRLQHALDTRRAQSRLRQLKSCPLATVDFSSNDFLSLSTTKELRNDYISELKRDDYPLGSMGSRLLDGNSIYAENLEREIAQFHGAEAGLLTNSGFDANVSIFMCIPQPGDVIVFDELIHASVHDGMRQSRATETVMFKHNCLASLREILSRYTGVGPLHSVFIAVESVYSMDGDLAPLREIVSLMRTMFPLKNCHLIVDEAHATGVYGKCGRGIVSDLQLETQVLIRLHTFGKALACNGAIILCSDVLKQYLLNYARPLIYTTFMSYPSLTAIKVVYKWLRSGRTEMLARKLFDLIKYMHQAIHALDSLLLNNNTQPILGIASECPSSPIFALMTNEARQLASYCQSAGFVVRAVVPPTVPDGTERVRVCLHAGNTFDEIDNFVLCVRQWLISRASGSTSVSILLKHAPSEPNPLLVKRESGRTFIASDAGHRVAAKL